MIVRLLFGLKVKDTQTGLKICKREVVEKVLPRLLVKQYAFDIEFLAVSHYLGFRRIYEAPIEIKWDFKSGSRFNSFLFMNPFIRRMLHDTAAVFYRLKILRYYDDSSKRNWKYNEDLDMKVNTGEFTRE